MKNNLILLGTVIGLYLISSLALQLAYGPSFGFLSGEDCWVADGHGGWNRHGNPTDPAPKEPSANIPIGVRYIPIFLPGAVLCLFLFTPLRRKLEPPAPKPPSDLPSDSAAPPAGA